MERGTIRDSLGLIGVIGGALMAKNRVLVAQSTAAIQIGTRRA